MSTLLPEALVQRLISLGAARHLLVCSDYDGTLAPLAPRPEQAQLLPGAFDLLHSLAGLPHTRLAIISGRSLDNLRIHSGLDGPVMLVGSHGAELPGHDTVGRTPEGQARLDALERELIQFCAPAPGAWLERKPLGIAVHVRQATRSDAEHVLAKVRGHLSGWPELHVREGKAVIELALLRTSKGDAVRWLRDNWGTDPEVLYLGDDVTDEAAFEALGPRDVGVKVGAAPSKAEYRVASEELALDVLTFIGRHRAALTNHPLAQQRLRGALA